VDDVAGKTLAAASTLKKGGEKLGANVKGAKTIGGVAAKAALEVMVRALAVDLAPIKAPVVLVCRTGRRSRRAAAALQSLGYRNIRILEGGTVAWEAATLLTAIEDFASGGDDVG